MNREEAIAYGMEIHETNHSMKRRSPWHDYHRRGTYMLTLVIEGRVPLFGELRGDASAAPGSAAAPHVELSELGSTIMKEEIGKISQFYPQLEVWKVCIMPDHIHMIVRVSEDLPRGKHLGIAIRGFKAGCTKAWWRLSGVETPGTVTRNAAPTPVPEVTSAPLIARAAAVPEVSTSAPFTARAATPATVPEVSTSAPRPSLFEQGYNDKILLHEGQLDTWKAYLDDNPRRLLLKRQHPELFTVLHDMEIASRKCQIVGNRFLLNIPDKMAVIVHRRYTEEENARLREEWLACGERGGVLVSAAIAPKEKEVLREAMNRGYRIILLRENGFPEILQTVRREFLRLHRRPPAADQSLGFPHGEEDHHA